MFSLESAAAVITSLAPIYITDCLFLWQMTSLATATHAADQALQILTFF